MFELLLRMSVVRRVVSLCIRQIMSVVQRVVSLCIRQIMSVVQTCRESFYKTGHVSSPGVS
jgi:hypothetical protein